MTSVLLLSDGALARPCRSQARLLASLVRVKSGGAAKRSSGGEDPGAADASAKRPKISTEETAAPADGEDSGGGLAGLIGSFTVQQGCQVDTSILPPRLIVWQTHAGDYGSDDEEDDETAPAKEAAIPEGEEENATKPAAAAVSDRHRSSDATGSSLVPEADEHVDYD